MFGQAFRVEEGVAVRTALHFSSSLAEFAEFLLFSKLNCFIEVLGVVGFASLGDIAFNGEVKHRNKEVQI